MIPLDVDRLRTSRIAPLEVHPVLESTQGRAKLLAREGAPHGYAVFAEAQGAGRGRLGRSWETPPGAAVLTTLVLRPALPASQAPLLCLAAAVATVDAIETTRTSSGAPYGIKWPNDVLSPDDRKVAGILAECEPSSDGGLRHVLLGIGLNVHAAPPLPTATCLDAVEGTVRDRTALAQGLLRAVLDEVDRLADAPDRMLDRWRAASRTLGRAVRIGEVIGVAEAIEASGALRVRDDAGNATVVTTGDVEMVGFDGPADGQSA